MGLINWEEIQKLTMPAATREAMERNTSNQFDNDNSADMYNQVAKIERAYTYNQINAFDTSKNDTVLDIGCGPGRISVLMAQRAKSVTSLDSSEKMLKHCRRNAGEVGVTNLNTILLDWNDAVPGKNVEQHDIVIASRSPGGQDIKKVSSFARKYVVFIGWANAPHIPILVGGLFEGVEGARQFPLMMNTKRDAGYNVTYNMVYDMGYDPNIKIVEDGFSWDYDSKEDAYKDLWKFDKIPGKIPPVFKKNVDKWLTKNDKGGVTFRRETKSYVIWWNPNPNKFWWELNPAK